VHSSLSPPKLPAHHYNHTHSLHDALPIYAAMTIISPMSFRKRETIKDTNPVIIEERETYFDRYNVSINVTIITTNSNGLTPSMIPPDVATALPPLNLAKSGYVCPKTAKSPMTSG